MLYRSLLLTIDNFLSKHPDLCLSSQIYNTYCKSYKFMLSHYIVVSNCSKFNIYQITVTKNVTSVTKFDICLLKIAQKLIEFNS